MDETRKRSTAPHLALMGAGLTVLAGCGDDPQPVQVYDYANVQQCIQAKVFTPEYCENNWEQAARLHQESAPRYANRADCQAEFGAGACQPVGDGSGWFMPAMMGFMLGNMMSSGPSVVSQPLYRPARDPYHYYTSGGYQVSTHRVNGRQVATVPKSVATTAPPRQTSVVSRGGFGSRARTSSSSWGS